MIPLVCPSVFILVIFKGCRRQRVPPSKGAAVRGYQEYLISVQEYLIFFQEYLIFVQEYFIFVQEYIFGKFTKDHLADLSRLLGLVFFKSRMRNQIL